MTEKVKQLNITYYPITNDRPVIILLLRVNVLSNISKNDSYNQGGMILIQLQNFFTNNGTCQINF